jgi:hypothetical protein
MAMAQRYSGVTHRLAVLVFNAEGRPEIIVAGHRLGVFAGLRLPRNVEQSEHAGEVRDRDERMER